MVGVEFHGTSATARGRLLPRIVEAVLAAGPTARGTLLLSDGLNQVVKRIYVGQRGAGAPWFHVTGCTAIEDRTVPEIAQKFRKGYETRAPTELLAYYDWGPAALAEDWLSDLPELVARELPSSPFRRVWVFDVGEGRILYVSPVIEGRERDSSSVDPNQHS